MSQSRQSLHPQWSQRAIWQPQPQAHGSRPLQENRGQPAEGPAVSKADLATRSLNIIDAGLFIGYDPQRLDRMGTGGTIETVGGRPRVLPDAPLRVEARKRFNADVRYRVTKVRAESFPISNVDLRLALKNGLMEPKPFNIIVAGGTVKSGIAIDARPAIVRTEYDVRLSPTPLGTPLARFGTEKSGTTGTVSGRIQMVGFGNSVRESHRRTAGSPSSCRRAPSGRATSSSLNSTSGRLCKRSSRTGSRNPSKSTAA